jgi:tRNA-specific 2-thiouridylase
LQPFCTGQVVLSSGEVMGAHDGLPFYTIGQRHLGVDGHAKKGESRPLFVVDKRTVTNELVVGYEDDALLYKKEVPLSEVSWVSGQAPKLPLQSEVRLRHRQELQKAQVTEKDGRIVLVFTAPQRAVTPGQFAVIYKDKECLGGGVV